MSDNAFDNIPHQSPLEPVRLTENDTIQFHCHKGVSCFNACCRSIDITLTPYDILRLKNHFNMTSEEFLAVYTMPFEMDAHGMPGVKIRPVDNGTTCPFLDEESGCTVYEDRPTSCRYYALGLMSMRFANEYTDQDMYFLVKEEHCKGHEEPRQLTVGEYRKEQKVSTFDEMNREWRQIILKKRSGGPAVGKPPLRSFQLFFLASYNLDKFRAFVQSPGFSDIYDLEAELMEQVKRDDEALLKLGYRLMKQVFFREMSIPMKQDAEEQRLQKRRQMFAEQKERENLETYGKDRGYDEPLPD